MFDEKLQKFLNTNIACLGGITRLQDVGAETLEEAWDKASDEDLIWAVTRPGIMDVEQRRLFLVMVLSSIENKLTDPCSKNILTKLRSALLRARKEIETMHYFRACKVVRSKWILD